MNERLKKRSFFYCPKLFIIKYFLVTNNKTYNIISNVIKEFKENLNEGSRDNLLMPYLGYVQKYNPSIQSISQLKQFLLSKFVNEANIRNLSLESNYYLAGVTRYYFEGKLTADKYINALYPQKEDKFIPEICERLSALILVLRNAYIDSVGTQFEQPEDFGSLSLEKLLRKYNKAIDKELGIEPVKVPKEKVETLNRDNHVGNGYTFDILYSYDEARKYNSFTEPGAWCITYGEQHYNGYIRRLGIHYVIFRKDGFENIPRQKTEGWSYNKPQDEYGNSLIAVLQKNSSWEPTYITSRWNHGSSKDNSCCEADHAYTTDEFMRITGVNVDDLKRILKIWQHDREKIESDTGNQRKIANKEKLDVLRIFKYAQMRMNGGNTKSAFGEFESRLDTVLTNTAKISAISHEALAARNNANGNEEEVLAKYGKMYDKALNNSVRSLFVTINDNTWVCLIDGNKILFETIHKIDGWYRGDFTSPEAKNGYYGLEASGYRNVILCSVGSSYMIYDTRKHKFVEVEGQKKFKFITRISTWEIDENNPGGFYEVKMTDRQLALIDINTNEPLVLPNGHSWMEDIQNGHHSYGRSVSTEFIRPSKNILHIIYDSSAREDYWYDMSTRHFFNINELIGNYDSIQVDSSFPYGLTLITSFDSGTHKNFLIRKERLVELNGISEFLSVKHANGPLFVYRPIGRGASEVIYDIETGQSYEVPQIDGKFPSFSRGGDRLIQFVITYRNSVGKTEVMFFSTRGRVWLKNPLNGQLNFMQYGINADTGYIDIYDDNLHKQEFKLSDNENEFIIKHENMYENKNVKRIILTRQQLNEVLKEENTTTVQLNTTGNTIPAVTNTVLNNTPEINNASKYGDVNLHISNQKLNGSNDTIPTQHVEVERGQNINQAIQQQVNPTVLSDGGDIEVSGDGISEHKCFSKKQIEEARLKKIHEGHKMTKKELKESFDTDEQWAHEIKMFMDGLRRGDYMLDGDTLYVEIFMGQTAENDPRYAYIRKGENRLHDDHFYMQDSPILSDSQLKDIYYNAGWEDMLPELIDYNGFEMYESKIEIKPKNKGKFNATKEKTGKSTEELTHSKNPLTRKRAIFAQNAKKWNKK